MQNFFTTKLTIDVTLSTQFGPNDAVIMMKNMLGITPAVHSAVLTNLDTDYNLLTEKDSNRDVMTASQIKLK